MSAAHELSERGFQVTVYEKGKVAGGKARSFGWENTGTNRRKDLPAEHGFRFFPSFYQHLPDTMKRIPYGRNPEGAFNNLVDTTQMLVNFRGRQHFIVPARFPRSLTEVRAVLTASGYLTSETGLTADDVQFYSERIWQLLTSCEERRAEELESQHWWQYIDADNPRRSAVYGPYLGGTTRVLVAADPKLANTKTVGDITLQLLFNLVEPGIAADRVLNGPTNEVWIDPWLEHLRARPRGVHYHHNTEVIDFQYANGKIAAVKIRKNDHVRWVTADYYVAALPVEKMAALVTDEMLAIDPTLAGIKELAGHVGWMNGIQFYLVDEPESTYGHQMDLDSPWALTSIYQRQFWTVDLKDYGDGTVRAILSVDISEWNTPGRPGGPANGKPAKQCTRRQVAAEVWEELKQSLPGLEDRHLHPNTPWILDPAIQPGNGELTNAEPLLVNQTNSWQLRPWARTRIPNLFLASDYVRTYTNLATMEAANEAARRAVNAIIDASGARVPDCRLWELHEPVWVKPWRWWDLWRYRRGLPWAAELPASVEGMAQLALQAAPAIGPPDGYVEASVRERLEQGIGLVPGDVQQQAGDTVLGLQAAIESGDLAWLRSLFAADAQVTLQGQRFELPSWVGDLDEALARGARVGLDVLRLEEIWPRGRQLVASFAARLEAPGLPARPLGRPGRLEVTLERERNGARSPEERPWLIRSLGYSPGIGTRRLSDVLTPNAAPPRARPSLRTGKRGDASPAR